jgi:hypothetical protein
MTKYKKILWPALAVFLVSLFACVTINVYFPAEKVESLAGDIVDDIRSRKPSGTDDNSQYFDDMYRKIRKALSPSIAYAADVTTVSNPTIRALKEKMKARFRQLAPYYQKGGVLNEGDNGYLSVAGTSGLSLQQTRDVKSLVEAENNDRKALYAEVAKALNIESGQISRISEIFAKEWQKPVR